VLGVVASSASAGTPRIVRTEPANGATSVPVTVGAVRVIFGQAMSTASATVQRVEGFAFPPVQNPPTLWENATTFVLRLQRLKPNTTYALQLNKANRKGFASAAGVPLPVTRLSFTTAPAATSGPASAMSDIFKDTAPARPAEGWRIVNVANDFVAYHDRARALGPNERRALWDSMLEAKYPAFFADAIYRKKKGQERERFKRTLIDQFWREVAPKIDTVRQLAAVAPARIQAAMKAFQKHFPDYKPSTDFYVTVSFTFHGKVVDVAGRNVFGLGVEFQDPAKPHQIDITIAHEIFHLYHFQFFRASGGLYRILWAEGMAVYASAVVVPGHRMSDYLKFPAAKMNRCQELLPQLAQDLKKHLGDSDRRIRRIYFGAEDNGTQVPPEAGYYVGLLIVQKVAKQHSLAQLARLEANAVFKLLGEELTRLSSTR
jgi:hypothetical protein